MDRTTWIRHCTPGDPFDDPRYGATLRAPTLRFISGGYGCWLGFLAARGWLDPLQPPLQRVTRGRLRAYFRALRAAGCADYTIIARFNGLATALKILTPGQDVSWIRRPDGVTIAALLPKTKRSLMVPDSGVLFQWAVDMMDTAPSPREYRDGLLLALLAARGRRLRSMALLRPGQELIWRGERYRIELTPEQVKTNKPDRFNLPAQLHDTAHQAFEPATLRGELRTASVSPRDRHHGDPARSRPPRAGRWGAWDFRSGARRALQPRRPKPGCHDV
jgi:hypothetical protein